MSDKPIEKPAAGPETQRQRWIKYGANTLLACVVVVLLGIILTALAQQSWAKLNLDTTQAGLYSLKPQTKEVLKNLNQKVRIVSLYTKTEPPRNAQEKADHFDYATPVADLLAEYERYGGGKVEVEVIDPVENPAKVDALIEDVTQRYGGEVKQYREFIERFQKDRHDALKKLLTDEAAVIAGIAQDAKQSSDLGAFVGQAEREFTDLVKSFDTLQRRKERWLAQKPPDYKRVTEEIRRIAASMSSLPAVLQERYKEYAKDPQAAEAVKQYVAGVAPRYDAIRAQATAVVDEVKKLGELKLDDLSQTLQERDSIVVLGPKDMRVLSRAQVWQFDPNVQQMAERLAEGKELRERFAGEQQITSAILGLTQETKPKVALVRGGGPPLAQAGGMLGRSGPLAQVAARLREYNFEVVERDLSGMWAMQSQMQGMPAAPEPTDEQIKDAIWIVLGLPSPGGGPMGAPPSIAGKVGEHLKRGGSAMVLMSPQGEDMSSALKEYGITVRPDAVVVHEPVPPGDGAAGDMINEAQKNPIVFITQEFGKHMLAEPVRSLDMPLIAAVPVSTAPAQGVTQWNLVPVPADRPTWGETNVEAALGDREVKLDPAADVTGQLFAGAAAKKDQGEGRVVVYGTFHSFTNDILSFPDLELLRRGVFASRFPGAGDLFTNSVFWLAKMEPMIAISPSAMEVSRIETMSKGTQRFWGVLVVAGLPLLVLLAGGLMYVRRRD